MALTQGSPTLWANPGLIYGTRFGVLETDGGLVGKMNRKEHKDHKGFSSLCPLCSLWLTSFPSLPSCSSREI
jgi:hypothetical protein